MLRRFMFLAMLTFAVSPAFANEPQQSESVGGTSVESVTLSEVKWLFSGTGGELWRARLARFRFERVAEVTTESGEATARLILRASSREVLDRITDGAFSLQVPPDQSQPEGALPDLSNGGARPVPTDQPDLYIIVEPSGEALSGFTLEWSVLPVDDVVVITAGHYQSLAVRNYARTPSYTWFYHVHCQDCGEHVLYQGGFTWCTYAYDCYAGHAVRSVRLQPPDGYYGLQFGTYCWEARCP